MSTPLVHPHARQIDSFELSPTQEGMLFHALSSSGSGVDVEQVVLRTSESLDLARLSTAWERVASRHSILRTAFDWQSGAAPRQWAADRVALPISEERYPAGLDAAEAERRFATRLAEDRVTDFDLSTPPLMRLVAVAVAPGDTRLLWSFHHALLDGRSFPLVLAEVMAVYGELSGGVRAELPVVRPYRDYIEWLRGRDLAAAERHWREVLTGFRTPTPLNVDRDLPGSPGITTQGVVERRLGAQATSALQARARELGATVNTLLQLAWSVLLHRYSGEMDVVFGATRACRRSALDGADDMIGLFINTLPVRSRLTAGQTVTAALAELRAQHVAIRPFEHTPLAKVQGWSEVPRGRSLFDSLVVYDNASIDARMRALRPGDTQRHWDYFGQTNYPVTVLAYGDESMLLRIEYDARRFDTDTAARMMGHLQTLLLALTDARHETIASLPMLADDERRQLLHDFNDTARDFAVDYGDVARGTLQQAFVAQARKTPDRVALEFGDATLTYRQLDERSNQLARHLIGLGVGPNQRVAISVERSLEMVVGLYGIIKAGGAYVPVDPALPPDRLQFMLEDAGTAILLTQERLLDHLPRREGQVVVCLDRDWSQIATSSDGPVEDRSGADDLAYMIFTSGSTGRPKGAMNAHRGIINRLLWMQSEYRLTEKDAVLQKTPFSFDVSVWEFFWPLLTGARLVVAEPGGHQDPVYLADTIAARHITVLHFVPSMLRAFVDARLGDRCGSLRDVMCSGEALPPDLVDAFHADFRANLHNLYGPTEAAVDVTYWPCPRGAALRIVPIGRPVANTQCYVLDPSLQPLPIGVPGELYLGGVQVGRGYLNRPELTAEKFIPDPFRTEPDARLYRTGDLCRVMPDGNIEYLGRIDHQVKIRGFRIELGEIEAVLASHPDVRDNVVMAREIKPGDKKLVAYVVGEFPDPGFADLREHLAAKVPEYMVPSIFVSMPKLPLNTNGKVDRGALPAPQLRGAEGAGEYVPPGTPRERTLAAIWEKVLRLPRVGANDNFFELGGDSILSIQVVSLARQQGLKLSPKLLFNNPTVAALATAATDIASARSASETRHAEAPPTAVQRWFLEQDLADAHWFNQAFLFSVVGTLDALALDRAATRLGERHDALRLRVTKDAAGRWNQTLSSQPDRVLERHDLSGVTDADLRARLRALAIDVQSRLDFVRGPIWRLALIDCGPARPARLFVAVHHLAVDGVSWRILAEDLEALYLLEAGASATLPEGTAGFLAWAHRSQDAATAALFADEAAHWAGVESAVAPLRLPVDFDRGPNTESSTADIVVELDEETTAALLQRAPSAYNTQINDLLLTALAEALTAWTGRDEIALNLEGHGREDLFEGLDVSRTLGWFTSIFPVHLSLRGQADVAARLCSVKEQLRSIPRRGIGYGVRRYIGANAPLAGCDPELVFNYLGQLDQIVAASTLLRLGEDDTGPWHAPAQHRRHLLEIDAQVLHSRLRANFRYSRNRHADATVERIAGAFATALRAIVAHCTTPGVGRATPADFPDSGLDQASLDRLTAGQHRAIADIHALSPMQSLFLTAATAGASVIDQWMCEFVGPLDPALLQAAWAAVLQRHPSLRTTFHGGLSPDPVQVIHRSISAPWSIEDLRSLDAPARESRWRDALAREKAALNDLSSAPLSRFLLAQVGDSRWKFAWTVSALQLDGWSWPLVFKDLSTAYRALAAGAQPGFAPTRAYRDYVRFMRHYRDDASQSFWTQELQGLTAATPLAPEATGSASVGDAYRQLHAPSDTALGERIAAAARTLQVTVSTLIQAAWALVLVRHTGRDDVLFGASFAARPAELEGIGETVGAFTNNLPVRVRGGAGDSLRGLISRVQTTLAASAEHQLAPLEKIQSWSAVPWHVRLFDSLVVVQNYQVDADSRRLSDRIAIEAFSGPIHSSYPVLLLVEPGTPHFVSLIHDTRAVSAELAGLWLGDLTRILDAIAGEPDAAVASLLERLSAPTSAAPVRSMKARTRALHVLPPQTALETRIHGVWLATLGLDVVSVDENLLDLGVQSLLVIRLHQQLRAALGRDFPVVTMFQYPTIRALADHLDQPSKATAAVAEVSDRAQRQREALARMKARPGRGPGGR